MHAVGGGNSKLYSDWCQEPTRTARRCVAVSPDPGWLRNRHAAIAAHGGYDVHHRPRKGCATQVPHMNIDNPGGSLKTASMAKISNHGHKFSTTAQQMRSFVATARPRPFPPPTKERLSDNLQTNIPPRLVQPGERRQKNHIIAAAPLSLAAFFPASNRLNTDLFRLQQ